MAPVSASTVPRAMSRNQMSDRPTARPARRADQSGGRRLAGASVPSTVRQPELTTNLSSVGTTAASHERRSSSPLTTKTCPLAVACSGASAASTDMTRNVRGPPAPVEFSNRTVGTGQTSQQGWSNAHCPAA